METPAVDRTTAQHGPISPVKPMELAGMPLLAFKEISIEHNGVHPVPNRAPLPALLKAWPKDHADRASSPVIRYAIEKLA